MHDEIYHNIRKYPFAQRENFKNTILLLTAVKSDNYYITGFSTPCLTIDVAFDFESRLHSEITEAFTVDFGADPDFILFGSTLKNIKACHIPHALKKAACFKTDDEDVIYLHKEKKDGVVPVCREKMNRYILKVKSDLTDFTEKCFEAMLSENKNPTDL